MAKAAGGFLKPKHPKAAAPEQPADPYADLYGYVTPPETTGLGGFVDQMKYINRTSPGAFMQLAGGLMGGDTAGGISNAGQELQQAQGEQRKLGLLARKDNLTRQWLQNRFPDAAPADLDAAMANPAVMSELLAPPDKRNLVVVEGKIYDADTGEWISPEGAGAGGYDFGNTPEARALEFKVQKGELTETQAADILAGKVVTNPADGSQWFLTPEGLVGKDAAGNPIDTAGSAEQPAVGGVGGGRQVTPAKKVEPTTDMKRDAKLFSVAQPELKVALDNFDALGTVRNTAADLATKLPGIAGDIGGAIQGYTTTPEYQRAHAAVETIVQSALYSVSGANAPAEEVNKRMKSVMPVPGEDAKSVTDKKRRLAQYVEAIRLGSLGKGLVGFGDLDNFVESGVPGDWQIEEVPD